MRSHLLVMILALTACASSQEGISQSELELVALADEKAKGARYPVLGALPGGAPGPEDFPPEIGPELRQRASELVSLSASTSDVGDPLTTEATVAELLLLVDDLQQGRTATAPIVDLQALDFPTPPPLN